MADKINIADLQINYEDVLKSFWLNSKKGIDDTKASTAELMAQKALEKGTQQYERNAKAIETNIVLREHKNQKVTYDKYSSPQRKGGS